MNLKRATGRQMSKPSLGSQALTLIFFQYLLCSFATSHTVSDSTSDATRGGRSGGASPNSIRPTANAQLESDSRVYPPYRREERSTVSRVKLTSSAATTLPPARLESM